MKLALIYGARPEFIRLSAIIPRLQQQAEVVTIHTGQNYDYGLNEVFFEELRVPRPQHFLEATGTFDEQLGTMFPKLGAILRAEKPDRFVVLGDTNSSMGAIVAKRLGIPVFHLESGNRCLDPRSPEEVNRRIIDHCSDVHMAYSERSRQNLLAEGIPIGRTYVIGNPMFEVIGRADRLCRAGVGSIPSEPFFLSTFHRQENVDDPLRLQSILEGLGRLAERFSRRVLVSTHPRTRARLEVLGAASERLDFMDPVGFKRFIDLERVADLVLSDSGTCPEECAIFGKPCVILRDSTERQELVESGCAVVAGVDADAIVRAGEGMLSRPLPGLCPPDYLRPQVSEAVASIALGHHLF